MTDDPRDKAIEEMIGQMYDMGTKLEIRDREIARLREAFLVIVKKSISANDLFDTSDALLDSTFNHGSIYAYRECASIAEAALAGKEES